MPEAERIEHEQRHAPSQGSASMASASTDPRNGPVQGVQPAPKIMPTTSVPDISRRPRFELQLGLSLEKRDVHDIHDENAHDDDEHAAHDPDDVQMLGQNAALQGSPWPPAAQR